MIQCWCEPGPLGSLGIELMRGPIIQGDWGSVVLVAGWKGEAGKMCTHLPAVDVRAG